MKKLKAWLPLIMTAALAAWFLSTLTPPPDTDFHFNEFGQLPLVFNGRLKPMDSLARNSLLEIREKQTLDTSRGRAGTKIQRSSPPTNGSST